ncbi:beta strand repeat-containing protein [Roseateles sp. DB2]|uniref:beta strand repeat-containing protein n=1 Tax=Roseateles sp. DB2 TaxID=3453717 RepID=UPI003EEC3BF0
MRNYLQQHLGRWLMALLAMTMSLGLVACGGGGSAGSSLYPGANSAQLSVSLSGTTVSSTARVTVTATLRDANGVGVPNQVVNFSFGAGGLADLSVASALTDANGNAVAVLSPGSSGNSGADTVVATSTYSGTTLSANKAFQVLGAASGAASLTVTLSSPNVTGSSPASVTAVLKDANGAPVAGQVVNFSFGSGVGVLAQLSSTTALTDGNGSARVLLTAVSTDITGADTVVATVAYNGKALSDNRGFQVTATSTSTASLTVALSSNSLTSKSSITATASLKDANGVGIPNQVIAFSLGTTLAQLNQVQALTDANGNAVVVLTTSGTQPGADTLKASISYNTRILSSQVNFAVVGTSTSSASLVLSLSSATVTAGAPATVTAVLKDGSGVAIPGQVVSFSTQRGFGALSAVTALTDATGTAAVTLSPANATSTAADSVSATTTVGSQTVTSNSVGFQLTATVVGIQSFTSDVPSGSKLAANGSSIITVKLSGTVGSVPVQLALASQCAAQSPAKATLTPTTATTTTGTATFTYQDLGCGAKQTSDTLSLQVVGSTVNATLNLPLGAPSVAGITFVSASPSLLYLSTAGYPPTNSTVIFQVNDGNGAGLAGKTVKLSPTTTVGGLTVDGQTSTAGVLPVITKTTDSNGQVRVLVNSGTVPTPVAIRATYTSDDGTQVFSSVSANLSIAVGLPTQSRFSLSQLKLNIEGYDLDGTTNTYTAVVADRLGNPVPPTTVVNFVNTLGQVLTAPSTGASTSLSTVSANSITGGQRPPNWDGRVTTLAYAIGEESFLDLNGDNQYNSGEDYEDLGDPYMDPKFRGYYAADLQTIPYGGGTSTCFSAATAPFQRFDGTNGAVGSARPTVPSKPTTCSANWGKAFVRAAVQTVWSTSSARLTWGSSLPSGVYRPAAGSCPSARTVAYGYAATAAGTVQNKSVYDLSGTTLANAGTTGSLTFEVADANTNFYNPMAVGTVVSATATAGMSATVVGGTVPNTLTPTTSVVNYTFTTASSGTITITVQSPSGLQTFSTINIFAGAAPGGYVACP